MNTLIFSQTEKIFRATINFVPINFYMDAIDYYIRTKDGEMGFY